MALYCGIDLHSTNCWISIINEERKVVREKKLGNDLAAILEFLEPHRAEIEGIRGNRCRVDLQLVLAGGWSG